jgi:UDP-N-acetylmuramoyl-L-alanyl-D-glutamate--2,6-diaminopimelate ligase
MVTTLPTAAEVLAALAAQGLRPRRLTADSRAVRSGDVFVAYPGQAADGRRYIGAAIGAGAAAVLYEEAGFEWEPAWCVPHVAVPGLKPIVGALAHEVYGRPSERLWMAGVTGTNGKTSTTQWLMQALNRAGRKTAVIGTLGLGFADALAAVPNTTPDAIVLHEALARFVAERAACVAMEVSSIGLDQARVGGVAFDCAVFTNLSRDHLDYHGTMEAYAQAKMQLFDWPGLAHAVVNLDDPLGVRITRRLDGRGVQRIGFSASGTAAPVDVETLLAARDVRYSDAGLVFRIVAGTHEASVATRLVGGFNVANLLAVCGVLMASGFALADAAALLAHLTPVPGRMQRVAAAGGPAVIVDYAHTPDALEKVLVAARDLARTHGGRLVAVFGCGGDRDRGKRPLMGAIAGRLADEVVLTSDNPRSESPEAIIDAIVPGLVGASATHRIEVDRRAAIAAAVRAARAGDVVVIAGKGHEPYQEIDGVREPFSDAAVAEAALRGSRA